MNVVQVGIGDFGFGWLKSILLNSEDIKIVGLVDKNTELLKKAQEFGNFDNSVLFTSITDALNTVKPDFVINITPPGIHKYINMEAFNRGMPVLSEKPIAENYEDAVEILNKSKELNVPIMIAENYRYNSIIRRLRQVIEDGQIGEVNVVYIDFLRKHRMTNYHKDLEHPLLLDVSIHHLDMLRYIVDAEATEVFAKAWNPSWSWYSGYPCVDIHIEMEKAIKASYRGSLVAQNNGTGWLGTWRIEGSKGVVELVGDEIRLQKGDSKEIIKVDKGIESRKKVLDEFINSLKEKRRGETDISDNIKTYKIVHASMESINKNNVIKIVQG
jgi:predicted dehydrogenase